MSIVTAGFYFQLRKPAVDLHTREHMWVPLHHDDVANNDITLLISLSTYSRLLTEKNEEVELPSSLETKVSCLKMEGPVDYLLHNLPSLPLSLPLSLPPSSQGIIGTDGRHYALDLFRVFPPDANYAEADEQGRIRHKLAVLRPELVETFIKWVELPQYYTREYV